MNQKHFRTALALFGSVLSLSFSAIGANLSYEVVDTKACEGKGSGDLCTTEGGGGTCYPFSVRDQGGNVRVLNYFCKVAKQQPKGRK